MQGQKRHPHLAAAALLAVAACSSEPNDAGSVWFVSAQGQVVTEDRSPVANSFVHAMWFDDYECVTGLIDDETTRTDAEGRYSILLEGRDRVGCLGFSVTPEPGSGLLRTYTFVQVADLPTDDFESIFALEWLLPPGTESISTHKAP